VSLIEYDLYRGQIDRVATAIERLKTFEPSNGYYLAYSGGKDSDTILALAEMAGVKFDAHYNLTTVDPPEPVYHIRKHKKVQISRPELNMFQLIVKKRMLPTRLYRFCCEYLKERGGKGRLVLTGIRSQESYKRAKRGMIETCYTDSSKTYLHPIIDWSTADVWEFIRTNKIEYCKLYDEGFKRLGCVMCPYSNMKKEAERFPKIAKLYKKAIIKAVELKCIETQNKTSKAITKFKSGEDMYNWWLSGKSFKSWDSKDRDTLWFFE